MSEKKNNYTSAGRDIIGDVHGHAELLLELLHKLGYQSNGAAWHHPTGRKAIFTGDMIHGGAQPLETLNIIRQMVEHGSAIAIAGNHEWNLLMHYTQDAQGKSLQAFTPRQESIHQATRAEILRHPQSVWENNLAWIRQLPLWWSEPDIRVIHACWHRSSIQLLRGRSFSNGLLQQCLSEPALHRALDIILKGPTIPPLQNSSERPNRLKWWSKNNGYVHFQDVSLSTLITQDVLAFITDDLTTYDYQIDEPLLFIGHYDLLGQHDSSILAPNVVCVDHGVKSGGRLSAYQWNPNEKVTSHSLISVA